MIGERERSKWRKREEREETFSARQLGDFRARTISELDKVAVEL